MYRSEVELQSNEEGGVDGSGGALELGSVAGGKKLWRSRVGQMVARGERCSLGSDAIPKIFFETEQTRI
jgi:hypothetical protein